MSFIDGKDSHYLQMFSNVDGINYLEFILFPEV